MKNNVGSWDQTARIVGGVSIMVGGAYLHTWWGALGIIPSVTGIIGVCPAYRPLGINTSREETIRSEQQTFSLCFLPRLRPRHHASN